MSWRALSKELGVKPYRLREWRRGVIPNTPHLIHLLGLAERLGLGEVLVRPITCDSHFLPVIVDLGTNTVQSLLEQILA